MSLTAGRGQFRFIHFHKLPRWFTYLSWLLSAEQPNFWRDPEAAIRNAYQSTDRFILENAARLGPGGSTAVTAIVIDGRDLWIANVGDSRAVVCKQGAAQQLSVDHEPDIERKRIEKQGGFVTILPGRYLTIGPYSYSCLLPCTRPHQPLLDVISLWLLSPVRLLPLDERVHHSHLCSRNPRGRPSCQRSTCSCSCIW